jgi:hypothetical protein
MRLLVAWLPIRFYFVGGEAFMTTETWGEMVMIGDSGIPD